MSNSDLPTCLRSFPITSPASAAHVVDALLSTQDRKNDSLLLLLCDRHGRPLQPIIISEVDWVTDRESRERTFDFLSTFVDMKVLVATSSGMELDEATVDLWQRAAEQQLGDRMLHFLTITPVSVREHDAAQAARP